MDHCAPPPLTLGANFSKSNFCLVGVYGYAKHDSDTFGAVTQLSMVLYSWKNNIFAPPRRQGVGQIFLPHKLLLFFIPHPVIGFYIAHGAISRYFGYFLYFWL